MKLNWIRRCLFGRVWKNLKIIWSKKNQFRIKNINRLRRFKKELEEDYLGWFREIRRIIYGLNYREIIIGIEFNINWEDFSQTEKLYRST